MHPSGTYLLDCIADRRPTPHCISSFDPLARETQDRKEEPPANLCPFRGVQGQGGVGQAISAADGRLTLPVPPRPGGTLAGVM